MCKLWLVNILLRISLFLGQAGGSTCPSQGLLLLELEMSWGWAGWGLELGHVADLQNATLVHKFKTLLLWKMSSGKCMASVKICHGEIWLFCMSVVIFPESWKWPQEGTFLLLVNGYFIGISVVYSERLHHFWWQNAGSVCLFIWQLMTLFSFISLSYSQRGHELSWDYSPTACNFFSSV